METEEMYYLDEFCCICMNKCDLKHLFAVDSDGVSHYNKLTSSIAEMNFKEMNDQRLICGECRVTLNTVYDFRQMCLRSKTNLITYISKLQTSGHISSIVRVCLKVIEPELIVVKNRGRSEKEGSNCLEGSNTQIKFQTESSVENIGSSALVKEEFEIEDDDSSAHEDATFDHVNEGAHSNVKVEVVELQTMMEDYSEYYADIHKIEIEEHPLEEMKEEPMSDTETPQDGSTSQADTETSEEPKGSEETTIGTELTQNTEKHNEGLHQCEICQKKFHSKDSLANHEQKHFSKKSCKRNLTAYIINSSERPYECEICKKGYDYKSYLIKHMNTHFGVKPYECEKCQKRFNEKSNLTRHMTSHTSQKLYKCEICKKYFKYKRSVTEHKKAHSSKRPYNCEICKRGFSYKGYLIDHMKIHSNERQYKCVICKKSFNYKSNLTVHMKIHSNKKPYECELCKKRFNHKSNLTVHMKNHSRERPYECEICKKGYKFKNSLTEHMNTHSSKRSYECEICKKGYYYKSSLRKHIITHSSGGPKQFGMNASYIKHMERHSDEKF